MREVGAVLAAVEPAGPGIADLEAAANVSELGRDGPEKGRGGPDEDLPGGRIGAPRSHGARAAKGLERAVFQGPSRGWLRGAGGFAAAATRSNEANGRDNRGVDPGLVRVVVGETLATRSTDGLTLLQPFLHAGVAAGVATRRLCGEFC